MKFEGKLEIGGLAMIIGCTKPENNWIIGKIVKIEMFTSVGDNLTWLYPSAAATGTVIEDTPEIAICSGLSTNNTTNMGHPILKNHIKIGKKYLMPLPPLEEEELVEERELEMFH
ncbi:hypothetical protein vB_PsyM_KIL4_0100 [Pseudomonas phage vB_PsyM_KIL4]|uniref:Uncharacterized protein n=3 Tax=Flaumdravirus TaxID=2560133 RepID=A0A142IE47_9CAUD|nr:hypothetical protein FDI83_gp113 [Pseudomonas phage vB_PsyM_KIL4]AMR57502.1 hypothetical protein vB_PsyM_KIL2_0102 [Pseudomonas phage vB_PsyM_KIL2]AMR57824.1 hypothetical protein vB_PsyM_KIL4_0100 [Pseudomonas phage vB_PsyM_KIL4]AMR57993.1 hypothetical protein vB_PsyM_KIL5_0102 [Pseudomonas phage vB_PsyM_KIL5]